VFPDELVWTFNKYFLEKKLYFGILKSKLCCIFGINTTAAGIVYKLIVAYSIKFVNCSV
jgi:hypothetical protein